MPPNRTAPRKENLLMTDIDSTATPGYADALRELDSILRELEGSDVDVDRLADRVTRASELITMCREKISTAQVHVEQVTAQLSAAEKL